MVDNLHVQVRLAIANKDDHLVTCSCECTYMIVTFLDTNVRGLIISYAPYSRREAVSSESLNRAVNDGRA